MIIKEASTSKKIRNIASENPVATAKQFYDEAAHGGIQHNIYDVWLTRGVIFDFEDGSLLLRRIIGFRQKYLLGVVMNCLMNLPLRMNS